MATRGLHQQVKIIYKCYPCNNVISRFIPEVEDKCSFCNMNGELIERLFYNCLYTAMFWTDFKYDIGLHKMKPPSKRLNTGPSWLI
uniref:Reverse transcriptase zinc-binding domain-containing protein n=1 Tax=Anguilla anguilla TaxID=7936 RepID=A0A0E9UCP7_ANGAN